MTTAQWIIAGWVVIGLYLYSRLAGKGYLAGTRTTDQKLWDVLVLVMFWPLVLLIGVIAKINSPRHGGKGRNKQ